MTSGKDESNFKDEWEQRKDESKGRVKKKDEWKGRVKKRDESKGRVKKKGRVKRTSQKKGRVDLTSQIFWTSGLIQRQHQQGPK
jgi:hypothetical protein